MLEGASLAWALAQSMDEIDNDGLDNDEDSFFRALTAAVVKVSSFKSPDRPAPFKKICRQPSSVGASCLRICMVDILLRESLILHSRVYARYVSQHDVRANESTNKASL